MIRIASTTVVALALSLSALSGAYAGHRIGGAPHFESHERVEDARDAREFRDQRDFRDDHRDHRFDRRDDRFFW